MGTTERGIAGYAEPREISIISTITRTRITRTPRFLELNSFPSIKISNEIYPEKSSLPSPFERLPRACHAPATRLPRACHAGWSTEAGSWAPA